ncbi:MAG: CinA family protein [Clostridia bacterium]|nr:CinA family protein [Clostridia bacterium]
MADFERLVNLLARRGMTVCAAESCTGGLFAARVVDVPDASKVLDRSFVTYAAEAKRELVGVPAETIARYGVVSEPVAEAMARGAALAGKAQAGVGITGLAGPSGGTEDCPVGTVCFGICVNGKCRVYTARFGNIGRNAVRDKAADFAAERLTEWLEEDE